MNAKEKLINALLELLSVKDFTSISVSELCHLANIHRTTFYTYFDNTVELLEETKKQKLKEYHENNKYVDSSLENYREEIFQNYFNFVKQQQNLFKAYFKNSLALASDKDFYSIFNNIILPRAKKALNLDETSIFYLTKFYLDGLFSVIKYWVNNGCKESPEYLAKLFNNYI